ncbi:MAG TPA: nuclear transport factor 2 family protein [Gemmataceae bacterium]|nr:nuclear transport factor 2 family protein [Gemmataceae bacterium]
MVSQRSRFSPLLIILLFVVVALAVFLNLFSARWARDRVQWDRQAIQEVLDAQVAAWNRGDLDGFMAGYWHSPQLTFFSGKDKTAGWQATLDRYRKRYPAEGPEKMGSLSFHELEIDVLSPDRAFVRGRWQLIRNNESLGGLFTLIFQRLPEGWRIVHDHTST